MDIKLYQGIEGAKQAKGLTVIIDVFRAFSVEAYFFSAGAEKIIPVGDIEKAYALKQSYPQYVLAGERHGRILPGFDCGNSPYENRAIDVAGKTIIHTTSAGTQGVANAIRATEVLGCSLVNAGATAAYIQAAEATTVSLVCMGLEGVEETAEDTLCARYIKSILEKSVIDITEEVEELKKSSGKKFFDVDQRKVFPEQDFYLCTAVDRFDFVLRYISEAEEGFFRKESVIVGIRQAGEKTQYSCLKPGKNFYGCAVEE